MLQINRTTVNAQVPQKALLQYSMPTTNNKGSSFGRQLAIVLLLLVTGCGDSRQMKVWPVSGRVLVNEKPATGVEVAFYGLDDNNQSVAPFPRAITNERGEFQLTSYENGDGAPAGRYSVTLVWPTSHSTDPETVDESRDRFRGKYASADTSTLTAEVVAGANRDIDFSL